MKLLLWGTGGHAKVVLDIAQAASAFTSLCFLDDAEEKKGASFRGYPIAGGLECLPSLIAQDWGRFLISIGDNRTRARRFLAAIHEGLRAVTLIHPSAIVSPSAAIGEGTVVMPRAVIQADARVGRNSIVNTGAIVEHDGEIGDHVHIAPGAVLGGAVKVGDYSLVGTGAKVLPGVEIGENAKLGAGAVALERVPPYATGVGVPARVVRNGLDALMTGLYQAEWEAVCSPGRSS